MKEEEGTCGEGRVHRLSSSVLVVEQDGMRWRGIGGGGRRVRGENKGIVKYFSTSTKTRVSYGTILLSLVMTSIPPLVSFTSCRVRGWG